MADEQGTPVEDGLDTEELYRLRVKAEAAEAEDGGQGIVRVLGLILILIAGALILLLRGCPAPGSVNTSDRERGIDSVAGKSPLQGSVAIWVDDSHRLRDVLKKARVATLGSVSLGKGRYVVRVKPGTESSAVKKLRLVSGVVDAGLVYDDGALKASDVRK